MIKNCFKFVFRAIFWIFAIIGGSTLTLKWDQANGPLKLHTNSGHQGKNEPSKNVPHLTIMVDNNN